VPYRLPIYLAAIAATLTACTTATATPATTTTTMPTTTTSSTTTSLAPTTTTTTTVVERAEEVRPASHEPPSPGTPAVTATATCGGNLPPCWICQRESHCTYGIVSNGLFCTGMPCFGAWQFDPRTWRGVVQQAGFADIPEWPPTDWPRVTPEMEDRVAAALWAGGQGCGHWAACS
jgi:hypothetical protein